MEKTLIKSYELSWRLGLSEKWIKPEAKTGKLPFLKVGTRMMFNQDDVEHALLERAQANAVESCDGGER